jgi:hypothetical protein
VVVALALILLIGFILVADPFTNDNDERDPAAMRATVALGF